MASTWLMFPAVAAARPPGPTTAAPTKSLITDGSIYHDVGRLWLNITNFDLIGSKPLIPSSYAAAPSGLWPAPGGKNYLCRAYLWVGGVLQGEQRASTEGELRATADPLDVIYEMAHGEPAGTRYPFGDPDDDGDGLADEDPRNGLDDDGDGAVDEDFAAISDQDFRLRMLDSTPEAQAEFSDHNPLGVEVVQQSHQWAGEGLGDFVGFDFAVRNIGAASIDNVYIGFFADFDFPLEPGAWMDDLAGYWDGPVSLPGGAVLPVFAGYMHDKLASTPGPRLGVVLLDHTTDAAGATAPAEVGVHAFRIFDEMWAYPRGMPGNDHEVYQALSVAGRTTNRLDALSDYKFLLSVGPFPLLVPGQTIRLQVAVVAGSGLDAMLQTAAVAKQVYEGRAYDRDGDPATGPGGRECQVRWLPPSLAPTPAVSGRLAAERLPHGGRSVAEAVRLRIEARHCLAADLSLERSGKAAADRRIWTAAELFGDPVAGEVADVRADLTDDDPAGWPRTYRLLLSAARGDLLELDRIDLDAPPTALRLAITAEPNPFNPRTTIRFDLPGAGQARLAVYDVAGRLVRQFVDGDLSAGGHEVVWDGRDSTGRAMPSGSYLARLEAGGKVETARLSLVR